MPTLIVAATSAGAGKTALAAAIADHLAQQGSEVSAATAWSDDETSELAATLGDRAVASPLGSSSTAVASVAAEAASEGLA